uniref:RNA-directed RNA polymerase n=1 Tax=Barrymore virus TaxID=2600340 RepID=A0A5B8X9X1_9VIRU|nr:RNA-dependent RNA polymerase [Barrymore virus]
MPKDKVKVAKRAWAETVPLDDLVNAFRTCPPREVARASEKFENGKSRAIYGVEPIHYIINTYATKGFEGRLHNIPGLEKGATGLRLTQLEHHRATLTADAEQHCSMLDYADFNRHHTPEAQAILFEELGSLGSEVGACSDWQFANSWVAKAKYHMTATIPGRQRPCKVVQGMFSGTKSTDLINTILNLAYFQMAQDFVETHYGVLAEDLYHVHQGDDVWLSNRNHLWARLIYYTMHQMGFIFQRSKQMFGEGRGEYLRVLYQGGHASGYLHRAIANFILRPLQNDSTQDPVAWANTIQEGVSTMCRRGLPISVAECIWTNAMNYWVRVRAHTMDKCGVRFPREAIELAAEQGGLGCPCPGSLVIGRGNIEIPALASTAKKLLGSPSCMTDDWVKHVSAHSSKLDLHRQIRSDALREMCLQTSYSSLPSYILQADEWSDFKEAVREWSRTQSRDLRRKAVRYPCRSGRDVSVAVQSSSRAVPNGNASMPLVHNLTALEAPLDQHPPDYMGLGTALNRLVATSRFKSVSATATAYGLSHTQALKAILASAGEDSNESQEARSDVQYLVDQATPEYLALLQRPGMSVITALSPFMDAGLLGYCSTQHNQVMAKYLALFGSSSPEVRDCQRAEVIQLTANTIHAMEPMFQRIRY